MRVSNFRFDSMLRQSRFDPRHKIASIGFIIGLLELAAAAFGKERTWRILMVRTKGQRSIVEERVSRNSERDVATA